MVQVPVIRAMVSKHVDQQDLGKAFGAIATIESTGQLFWQLAVDQLYKAAIDDYPPAIFLFGSGLCAVSFVILTTMVRDRRVRAALQPATSTLNEYMDERAPLLLSEP